MESIIKNLYFKNINIGRERFIEREKFELLLKQRAQYKHELLDTLNMEQRALYEKIQDVQIELIDHYSMEYYIIGFKMGGHFVMEILGDSENHNVSD